MMQKIYSLGKQFELKDGVVHCKCGNHAVKFRDGYLCSGITIPHGCTYKEEKMNIEQFKEKNAIGQKVLEKFFKMSDKEIKEKLKDLLDGRLAETGSHAYGPQAIVTRKIRNEQYESIHLDFYDNVEITSFNIKYISEHGIETVLINFDKYFNVDAI